MKTNSVHLPFNPSSIFESQGTALASVSHALFANNKRKARDRIYWFFSPDKDPRVVEFMKWVKVSSPQIAELGVQKFIQTGERGALMANVEFCINTRPTLDWLTYADLQKTMDFVLQESAAWYNPAKHVLLFVFLPSKSTNSVAIWRKMIDIPDKTKRTFQSQLKTTVAGLKKPDEYAIHLDEYVVLYCVFLGRGSECSVLF
ncbi:hypothetical protein BDN72DRAFT_757105 [Pluteus cervinus]|uniref:Uncharacterized protein n=1 Tax=Pluteus cervinus TaxID=181527 RepID=A0ACD3BE84_9AGAR|nr:hypothetical protein BDN72DRAFT_757105 [Pluteus cervinus]